MEQLLAGEHDAFLQSLDGGRSRGLRANPAKVDPGELAPLLDVDVERVAWCSTGFTTAASRSLGTHPAHVAGLIYLQEPSAMSVAEALDPQPGWTVIDLAAAPGGKTTHLSALAGAEALIVANEVSGRRLTALHENLDRWGAGNVVTCSLRLDQLAASGITFDAALLDAPCSGEGLFRRDPEAIRHWSPAAVAGAARRQRQLLSQAATLERPGGILVYSTCTFNVTENEEAVAALVSGSDHWELEDCVGPLGAGPSPGHRLPGLESVPTERTARFWPHRTVGEGQFVARLRRSLGSPTGGVAAAGATGRGSAERRAVPGRPRHRRQPPGRSDVVEAWHRFQADVVPGLALGERELIVRETRLYAHPSTGSPVAVERLARPGLPLGQLRPGRFQPHPALAAALRAGQAADAVCWEAGQPELAAYLRGETVASPGDDGWVLVCFRQWGLGWGRRSSGVLKNFLPPALRDRRRRGGSGGNDRRR